MPQNQPFSALPTGTAKKTPAGWVWVAGIVIVVAAVLFVTQKTAPSGDNQDVASDEDAAVADNAPTIVDVPAVVTFDFRPTSVPAGTIFGVDWKVETPEQTFAIQTAVYWDRTSHPGNFGTDVTPKTAGYSESTTGYEAGYFALPGSFEDNIKLSPGDANEVLYMRAYVSLAGKHYWSDEMAVPVKVPGSGGGS